MGGDRPGRRCPRALGDRADGDALRLPFRSGAPPVTSGVSGRGRIRRLFRERAVQRVGGDDLCGENSRGIIGPQGPSIPASLAGCIIGGMKDCQSFENWQSLPGGKWSDGFHSLFPDDDQPDPIGPGRRLLPVVALCGQPVAIRKHHPADFHLHLVLFAAAGASTRNSA